MFVVVIVNIVIINVVVAQDDVDWVQELSEEVVSVYTQLRNMDKLIRYSESRKYCPIPSLHRFSVLRLYFPFPTKREERRDVEMAYECQSVL